MHSRSSRAIISAGYRLYTANFRKLLRRSWPMAIAYAIATGAFVSHYVTEMPRLAVLAIASKGNSAALDGLIGSESVMSLVFALLMVLTTALLFSTGFSALKEHLDTNAIQPPKRWYGSIDCSVLWQTLKGLLWSGVAICFIGIVFGMATVWCMGYLGRIAGLTTALLFVCIAIIVLLPLNIVLVKYVLTGKQHFVEVTRQVYPLGIRHWGLVFIVAFVVLIATTLLMLVVQLPANILCLANLQSQMGALMEDPLGMPEYIGRLNFAVFALMGFLQAYIHLSTLFPFYYLYGSIEQQEKERKEMK